MALRISPRNELDNILAGTKCSQALDISKKLKTDTVASYSYKIFDSSDNEVTDTFGGGSSISSGIITFGIKAISAGTYTLQFIITCNEVLPDGITPREFYITMTIQIIATALVKPEEEESAFVFTIQTAGDAETFSLPLEASGTYDFTIDWGDSSSDDITVYNQAEVTHTYADVGTYEIKITGIITGWRFNGTGDKLKLYGIKSWGPLRLGNNRGYFYGCSNLTVTATDILDLTGTTDLESLFDGCSSLTSISFMTNWDMSSVEEFLWVCYGCTSLTSIPNGLLDNCSLIYTCTECFSNCTSLLSIPDGLFDDCILVTYVTGCFDNCISLTAIPSGLFNNCVLITSFYGCFKNCIGINTDLPINLILYNAEIDDCRKMFKNCGNMTGDGTAFVDKAEEHGISLHNDCFTGCTSLPDYNLIPANWGGGGA